MSKKQEAALTPLLRPRLVAYDRRKTVATRIKDLNSFRRHRNACPQYRERWLVDDGKRTADDEVVLYEVYCLLGMPPQTFDDQQKCMQRRVTCWRTGESVRPRD